VRCQGGLYSIAAPLDRASIRASRSHGEELDAAADEAGGRSDALPDARSASEPNLGERPSPGKTATLDPNDPRFVEREVRGRAFVSMLHVLLPPPSVKGRHRARPQRSALRGARGAWQAVRVDVARLGSTAVCERAPPRSTLMICASWSKRCVAGRPCHWCMSCFHRCLRKGRRRAESQRPALRGAASVCEGVRNNVTRPGEDRAYPREFSGPSRPKVFLCLSAQGLLSG
jgi:hypothetical protein